MCGKTNGSTALPHATLAAVWSSTRDGQESSVNLNTHSNLWSGFLKGVWYQRPLQVAKAKHGRPGPGPAHCML